MQFKKNIFILVFLLFPMLIQNASNANSPTLTPSSFLKSGLYTNKEKGYSIKFPLWWSVEEANQGDQIKASRQAENSKDQFQEKAALSVLKADHPLSLETFYTENLKGLQQLQHFQEINKGGTSLSQTSAKWIVYSFQPDTLKNQVQILQYFLVKNQQTCILTFISTPLQFNQYKNQFQQIAQSFALK